MRSRTCSVCLVLLLWAWGTLHAQVYTGTIAGRVTDQTGAVLPGVSIILNADVLIRPETAVSSSTGAYRFAELPIGTYTLSFELPAFQKFVREGIILTAGSHKPSMPNSVLRTYKRPLPFRVSRLSWMYAKRAYQRVSRTRGWRTSRQRATPGLSSSRLPAWP